MSKETGPLNLDRIHRVSRFGRIGRGGEGCAYLRTDLSGRASIEIFVSISEHQLSIRAWMHAGAENVQGFKYLKPIVALVPQTDYEKDRQIKDIFYLLMPLGARQRGKRTSEEGKDRD